MPTAKIGQMASAPTLTEYRYLNQNRSLALIECVAQMNGFGEAAARTTVNSAIWSYLIRFLARQRRDRSRSARSFPKLTGSVCETGTRQNNFSVSSLDKTVIVPSSPCVSESLNSPELIATSNCFGQPDRPRVRIDIKRWQESLYERLAGNEVASLPVQGLTITA